MKAVFNYNPYELEKREFNKKDHRTNLLVRNFEVDRILAVVDTNLLGGIGHSSILFLDKNNRGIAYNTSCITDIFGALAGKDIDYRMNRLLLAPEKVIKFITTGKLSVNEPSSGKTVQNEDFLIFTKYISMPIKTKSAGKAVLTAADKIYQNPGKYNLWERNCNHIIQESLSTVNLNYGPVKGNNKEMLKVLKTFATSIFLLNPKAAKKLFEDTKEKLIDSGAFPTASLERAEVAVSNGYITGTLPLGKDYIQPIINFLKTKKKTKCEKSFVQNIVTFYKNNKKDMSPAEDKYFSDFISYQRKLHTKDNTKKPPFSTSKKSYTKSKSRISKFRSKEMSMNRH